MNLKAKLSSKLKKSGGFTLVEMLVVVAIIAILILVSIPVVGTSLDKARKATDDANMRAAKAVGTIHYLTEEDAAKRTGTFYYDAETGTLVPEADGKPTGYGQHDDTGYELNGIVEVEIDDTADEIVTCNWVSST